MKHKKPPDNGNSNDSSRERVDNMTRECPALRITASKDLDDIRGPVNNYDREKADNNKRAEKQGQISITKLSPWPLQ